MIDGGRVRGDVETGCMLWDDDDKDGFGAGLGLGLGLGFEAA